MEDSDLVQDLLLRTMAASIAHAQVHAPPIKKFLWRLQIPRSQVHRLTQPSGGTQSMFARTASMLLTPCHLALEAAVRQACRSARPAPWRPQRLHAGTQPPSPRQRCAMLHAPVSQHVGQHVKHRPHV